MTSPSGVKGGLAGAFFADRHYKKREYKRRRLNIRYAKLELTFSTPVIVNRALSLSI